MAESVKRRVAAARLAVAFVAAGAIAGTTAWAQAGSSPPTARSSALQDRIQIDSSNIKNKSLLYQDFKSGQVPSMKQFIKFEKQFASFRKAVGRRYYPKVQIDRTFAKLADLDHFKVEIEGLYLKNTDSVLRGDGSVHTATGYQTGGSSIQLLSLPGALTVEGIGNAQLKITNDGSAPLTVTACTAGAGGGVLDPGKSMACDAGPTAQTVQLIDKATPKIMTLNYSAIADGGGGTQDTVQILIGL
jgi:hypothetical protein